MKLGLPFIVGGKAMGVIDDRALDPHDPPLTDIIWEGVGFIYSCEKEYLRSRFVLVLLLLLLVVAGFFWKAQEYSIIILILCCILLVFITTVLALLAAKKQRITLILSEKHNSVVINDKNGMERLRLRLDFIEVSSQIGVPRSPVDSNGHVRITGKTPLPLIGVLFLRDSKDGIWTPVLCDRSGGYAPSIEKKINMRIQKLRARGSLK